MIRFQVLFFFNVMIILANAFHNPHYVSKHSVIVQLFEWKWNDIADECEQFLGPNGYGGIQVSPVSENVIVKNRPWWERYQPISYEIITRSGDKKEFKSMVHRCNKAGVRIYADAVINHMARLKGSIHGTGGSTADVDKLDFPAVPYGPSNFHDPCDIHNYNNATEVRVCRLESLPDLDQGRDDTRAEIAQYMNDLIAIGVAGFRIDAAKHMWPSDLKNLYKKLNNLNSDVFPPNSTPFIFQEVPGSDEEVVKRTEYNHLAAVTEFKYTEEIGRAFRGNNQLKWLKSIGPDWGMLPSMDAVVFVDNHDNQRSNDGIILTYKSGYRYNMAVAFTLAHPYGIPKIMSSYNFSSNDQGPPSDENEAIITPNINSATGQCVNGWVCEHRWPSIRNMVAFRNDVGSAPLNSWWDNDSNQIAFCRGNRGFIAFNNDQSDLNMKLNTCLPSGNYCDVITGQNVDGQCTGAQIAVDENGQANINLVPSTGVLAIHIRSKI